MRTARFPTLFITKVAVAAAFAASCSRPAGLPPPSEQQLTPAQTGARASTSSPGFPDLLETLHRSPSQHVPWPALLNEDIRDEMGDRFDIKTRQVQCEKIATAVTKDRDAPALRVLLVEYIRISTAARGRYAREAVSWREDDNATSAPANAPGPVPGTSRLRTDRRPKVAGAMSNIFAAPAGKLDGRPHLHGTDAIVLTYFDGKSWRSSASVNSTAALLAGGDNKPSPEALALRSLLRSVARSARHAGLFTGTFDDDAED